MIWYVYRISKHIFVTRKMTTKQRQKRKWKVGLKQTYLEAIGWFLKIFNVIDEIASNSANEKVRFM